MKVISLWDLTETKLRKEISSGKNQTRQKFSRVYGGLLEFVIDEIFCSRIYFTFKKFYQIFYDIAKARLCLIMRAKPKQFFYIMILLNYIKKHCKF